MFVETNKQILKLFSPSGSPTTLYSFSVQNSMAKFLRALTQGRQMQVGYEDITFFNQYVALSG